MTTTVMPPRIHPSGYRLPEHAHVGIVRLQVRDLAVTGAYYTRVLGFRILSEGPGVAVLGVADGTPLIELHEQPGIRPVPRRGLLGLYHFAVLLPDRIALGRFLKHISELGVYAGSADHLVSEALYLSDPDGLGIEVYADRPRADWKIRAGEIVMATEPLDLRSLIRAGGSEPWAGMPSGTTIGHVHFHVDAIDEAERFYQGALGFDKVVWSYPGALFFSAGGYHHHVGTNTWAVGAPVAGAGDARLLEWELRLPAAGDVEELSANAVDAGYAVRIAGDDRLITDPWGITVRLTNKG